MPEENGQWKDKVVLHIQLSLDDSMLKMADELLSLGAENTSHEKALAASATVILATALEQGVMNKLWYIVQTSADLDGVGILDTPYGWLVDEEKKVSFRRRMVELPRALSANKYQLDPNSLYVRNLHDLISWRNELLHIRDEVQVLKASQGRVIVECDDPSQGLSFIIPGDAIRMPEFPWGRISLKQALEFREAVGAYFEELLDRDPSSELSPGKIIIESPQQRNNG